MTNDSDKTKEQLIEELELLRALIDGLPDRLYVKDKKGRFVICNKAVAEDADFPPPGDLVGKSDFDTFPPEEAKVFCAEEQKIIETGQPVVNHELYRVHRTGRTSWTLITKLPWRNSKGEIIGIIGSNRDITEQKKAVQALQESEARYKAIFNSASEGILIVEIEKKQPIYANPAFCRMFGYAEDELRKMTVYDLHPEEYAQNVDADFVAQKQGQRISAHNIPCRRKDGAVFFVNLNTAIVVIDQKQCGAGFFTDVTRQMQSEQALRESEQRYRLLVEQLPAVTYTAALDEASTTLYVSPQVKEILGITPADYKADPDLWRKHIHPDDRDRIMAEVARARQAGSCLSCEYRMMTKEQCVVWIHDDARIVEDSQGRPMYLQGVMYNITERKNTEKRLQKAHDELEARVRQRTAELVDAVEKLQKEIAERKRAEESLRQTEQRFRTIFENTVVGLYRTTPDGRILLANPALVKMMGYNSFEELAKLDLEKGGFDPSTPRSVFKQRIEKEGKVIGLESGWIRRDGTVLFVSESASAVRDRQGNILYYEGTAQDITERKKAEEKLLLYQRQLRSLASQLSRAEEQLRRRIATELHDHISQNLAISKMKLESLADSAEPGLSNALKEITALIARTIDATRSLTFELSPPVLYELGLEAALGWLARQTRQRFGLDVELTDDGKQKLLGTDVKTLLFQAVRELLVNIVKHARAGKANIAVQKARNHIQITVTDDGIGFDASGTPDYAKGGFGLFNIRERLDCVGGNIDILSSPGQGTKVILTAPIPGRRRPDRAQKSNRRKSSSKKR